MHSSILIDTLSHSIFKTNSFLLKYLQNKLAFSRYIFKHITFYHHPHYFPQNPHSYRLWRVSVYCCSNNNRWSPRGRFWPRGRSGEHILKSLALVSKVKSLALASKPQVLKNCSVHGLRTALFFELLKVCGAREIVFGKRFFLEIAWKKILKTFFLFWRTLSFVSLAIGLRPRAFLSLALRVSVLGRTDLGLGLGVFCILGLEPCVFDSTSGNNIALEPPSNFCRLAVNALCPFWSLKGPAVPFTASIVCISRDEASNFVQYLLTLPLPHSPIKVFTESLLRFVVNLDLTTRLHIFYCFLNTDRKRE